MTRLRLIARRFTSCSGCQLTLLNLEQALAALAPDVDLVRFDLCSSTPDDRGPVDLVLVEGSLTRPEHLTELLALRRRANFLVAVGACALSGGVNALADAAAAPDLPGRFPPQPVMRFVPVDLAIPGCPPEEMDYLQLFGALRHGGLPELPEEPVCMECRSRELSCLLLEKRLPCLGTVTRGGCGARCPARGVPCEGCRGLAAEPNLTEANRLLLELGLKEAEIRARLERFERWEHAPY
jgi:sulfhydrogenase subunit delta